MCIDMEYVVHHAPFQLHVRRRSKTQVVYCAQHLARAYIQVYIHTHMHFELFTFP